MYRFESCDSLCKVPSSAEAERKKKESEFHKRACEAPRAAYR